MGTMNVSLPDELKAFVDEQVQRKSYGSSSEYIRDLLRREQDREHLRGLLLEGMASPLSGVVADKAYFEGLRARAREWSRAAQGARKGGAAPARAGTKARRG